MHQSRLRDIMPREGRGVLPVARGMVVFTGLYRGSLASCGNAINFTALGPALKNGIAFQT